MCFVYLGVCIIISCYIWGETKELVFAGFLDI